MWVCGCRPGCRYGSMGILLQLSREGILRGGRGEEVEGGRLYVTLWAAGAGV